LKSFSAIDHFIYTSSVHIFADCYLDTSCFDLGPYQHIDKRKACLCASTALCVTTLRFGPDTIPMGQAAKTSGRLPLVV